MSEEIDIDYVASLPRIHLTHEEKQTVAGHLSPVLEHFDKIKAADAHGVEPTRNAFPLYNVLEADQAEPGFTPEEALRNAPAQRNNQVIVPKVIDGGE